MENDRPGSYTVHLNRRHELAPLVDQFLLSAKMGCRANTGALEHDFEVKSGYLSNGPISVSENAIAYLKHRDEVVAVALQTRNRLGHIRCDFFRDSEKAVPGSLWSCLDDSHEVAPTVDQFFSGAVEAVRSSVPSREADFRVESGELAFSPTHIVDDRATYLKFRDRVVALVMKTRTWSNHVMFDFFRDLRDIKPGE